jgi:hypothetical protein
MIPTIATLEQSLQNSLQYIERYYADPNCVRDDERLGFCKGAVEYIPFLITLLKIDQTRQREIQNDDLWREIDRLQNKIANLETEEANFGKIFPTDIEDTHYYKPDPRLVCGDGERY